MRVLLVDHDSEGLETITRAIRGVLELDCVTSKGDALLLLRQNTYDVLIACERAVDGSGLDLLGRTTRTAVPLKRIFAAAPERLQLLGPRLAPFKVQRTINYPIDLEELWLAIAQVTGGPNDETDGTIERVVLDERGIPVDRHHAARADSAASARAARRHARRAATGATRRRHPPLPHRRSGARAAAARVVQPAPEPPLRAPPPPRQPPPAMRQADSRGADARSRHRPMKPIPPMPMPPSPSAARRRAPVYPAGRPNRRSKTTSPRSPRRRASACSAKWSTKPRVARRSACSRPAASPWPSPASSCSSSRSSTTPRRARANRPSPQEVTRMAEQQKVTDNLTLIEIDIENAIMNNDLDTGAHASSRTLVEKSPDHPRREFLQDVDRPRCRARRSWRASPRRSPGAEPAACAPSESPPRDPARGTRCRSDATERTPNASPRAAGRTGPPAPRRDSVAAARPRTYGAPIGEPPRQATHPARCADQFAAGAHVRATDNLPRPHRSKPATPPSARSSPPRRVSDIHGSVERRRVRPLCADAARRGARAGSARRPWTSFPPRS